MPYTKRVWTNGEIVDAADVNKWENHHAEVETALGGKAPTSHTHPSTALSDSTTVGRALITAADANAARTAIGAPASAHTHTASNISDSTTIGRSVLTAADSTAIRSAIDAPATDHDHAAADITDSTITGRSVLTAADANAARAAIGAGTSNLTVGTSATQAKAGNYQPTWDQVQSKPSTFAPSAHSHAQADITGLATALTEKTGTTTGASLDFGSTLPAAGQRGRFFLVVPDGGSSGIVTAKLPVYVSPAPDSGTSYTDAFETRATAGWGTAFYGYWPGDPAHNSEWAEFYARHPEGLPTLLSPKGTTAASVQAFLDAMPQAWRDKCIMAYYQEPEDNFTTTAQRTTFRNSVATLAGLVRPYGVRNAVHLQEWAINPSNSNTWGGEANLAEFVNAPDIDYMSWSLYPAKGNSMRPGIDRIKAFSEKYAPGKPWGVTAAGSPVLGTDSIGGTDRDTRAQIVRDAGDYIITQGGKGFGWFDFDEYNPGRDQLASKDPALEAALKYVAALDVPGGLPWS